MTHVAGWFILGSSSVTAIDDLQVGQHTIYPDPIPTNAYINQQDAANMSTQELVQYIMNHDAIIFAINNPDPSISFTPLYQLISRYPVLSELMDRDGIGEYLLPYTEVDDETVSFAALKLFEHWYSSVIEDFDVPVE